MIVQGTFQGKQVEYRRQNMDGKFVRKDANLRVPNDGGRYVQIKHYFEIFGEPHPVPYPVPEIVNKDWGLLTKYSGREYDYVALENRWQWFLWHFWDWASEYRLPVGKILSFYKKPNNERTFAEVTLGSLMWVYVNMIEAHRAWTESASPEGGFRDAVTGRNVENNKPYAFLLRPTAGNMLRVIGDNGRYWIIEAIDLLKPCPPLKYIINRPWLYFWATQANQDRLPDGRYVCSRFPQIKEAFEIHGLPVAGTPVPLMSLGGSFQIKKTSCHVLESGAAWTPYIP